MSAVLESVPSQDDAMGFLVRAVRTPHHAYLFAGPEGSGKQLAARAFVAALLCADGGCGECRACRLALDERHPNVGVVEAEGRDIRVDAIREQVWNPAYRTAPEPGRKVFVIREADRLNPAAADVLLKVLEEPPVEDAVLLLLSARPEELPETIRSRCHTVTFHPLPEAFVVDALVVEGVTEERAVLAARLAGSNMGRARRLARDRGGLAFRAVALQAALVSRSGDAGPLEAAETLLAGTAAYRKGLKEELAGEVEPMVNADTGRPDEGYAAIVKRIQERFHRRDRRAEREFLDWSLLALQAWHRDVLATLSGAPEDQLINVDLAEDVASHAREATAPELARAMDALERARAALADETNLNPRLILEEAFLRLARVAG
ncbi:MAG: AAA family ATPase [Actinobacteria bacterium]|nr:AAA family ATPase [Actinomycetota bacterium]